MTVALTFSALPGAPAATRAAGTAVSPIQHIVFISKEDRSFDEYFGAFPDPGNNVDGSTTASCYCCRVRSSSDDSQRRRARYRAIHSLLMSSD